MVFNGPLSLLPQHTFITPEPIRTELVDGRMVKIEDDNEHANLFIRWIEQFDDDRVYQFAHVGAGVDHRVDLGVVDVTAWESLLGAVVVGVGASSGVGLQGGAYALGHMDATLMESNLFVDGRPVIETGRYVRPRTRAWWCEEDPDDRSPDRRPRAAVLEQENAPLTRHAMWQRSSSRS